MEHTQIIYKAVSNEKCIRLMESENKLTFLVHLKATKAQVKQAVETLYNAKVLAVNTMIAVDGKKTAYVRLDASTPAIDVATSLGLL